jgi:iron complex outermembrane receptor protein
MVSMGEVTNTVDVLTADEIRKIVTDDATATGNNTYKNLLGTANTDWQSLIYQDAWGFDNNISASGSIANIPYRASLGYLNQDGILKTNNFDRLSTSLNLSPKFFDDHLAVNLAFKYSQTSNRFANDGAVRAAARFDPTQPIYDSKGNNKYGGYYEWLDVNGKPIGTNGGSSQPNPLSLLDFRHNNANLDRTIGNVQLDYKLHFFPDLHVMVNLGLDNASGKGDDNIDSISVTDAYTGGRRTNYKQEKKNYLADVSLFYAKRVEKYK